MQVVKAVTTGNGDSKCLVDRRNERMTAEFTKEEAPELTDLRHMTPEQRLNVAEALYWSAREWKAAALRAFHPEWTEPMIQEIVRGIFLYGRAK